MRVHDRLGLTAVATAGLREVVEDRDELDVVARRRRGDLGEVRQRCDVARLVQAQQQRQREPSARQRRALVGAVDDLGEQRQEDRPQQFGGLRVTDQVERRALVEEAVGGDLAASRGAEHTSEPVGPQQPLRGGLDRGAGAVGL